jgi:hypothetical protein
MIASGSVRRALGVLLAAGVAHADPVALDPGEIEAQLVVEYNLAPTYAGQPTSLAPDVWVGTDGRWTVGLVNSDPALDVIAPGASLCVRTDSMICPRVYHGSAIDVRWLARGGELAIAPRARLLVRDIDPWKPAVTVGALARWTRGRWQLTGDPYLLFGLANTDRGNRAQVVLPVELAAELAARWRLELRTGYHSDVAVWRDGYHVPGWVGARVAATPSVDVGAALGFYSLLGPQATAKQRALFITVGWRSML